MRKRSKSFCNWQMTEEQKQKGFDRSFKLW